MNDLEARIAEQRELAETAIAIAEDSRSPSIAKAWRDKARSHYSMMAGLISMRSDERVRQE